MIYRDERRKLEGTESRQRAITTNRHIVVYGENSADVERWLRETPAKWTDRSSQTGEATRKWDLGAGYAASETMMRDGWADGAKDMQHRLQAILPAASREARFGHSVYGSSVNIGRYLTGQPNNMRRKGKRESGSAPVFHIVVNVVCSAGVGAEHFANYGTAIAGLIDRL